MDDQQGSPEFRWRLSHLLALPLIFFFFFKEFLYFYYLFIYLFIFGCVGSSFLYKGFL